MNRIRSQDLSGANIDFPAGVYSWTRTNIAPPSIKTGNTSIGAGVYKTRMGWAIMSDWVAPRLRDNPVLHRKVERDIFPTTFFHTGGNTATTGGFTEYGSTAFGASVSCFELGSPLMMHPDGKPPGGVVRFGGTDDDRIIQSMYKTARAELVQGLVNLVELRQFPRAMSSIASVLPRKKEAFQRFYKRLLSFRGSKRLSSAYLAYQFGIAPLLSDIVKVNGFLSEAQSLLARFESGDSLRISRVYPGRLDWNPPVPNITGGEYLTQEEHKVETRYTLVYRYRKVFSKGLLAKIQYILQRMGFLSLANAAWELTPWSFVVDWFMDTSGILMNIDDILGLDPIETISCVKSNKWTSKVKYRRVIYGLNASNVAADQLVAEDNLSYYARSPLGRSTYVGPSNRFGKKQLLLSVALARQRLR